MKIPGFGGAAANSSKVDFPPANGMGAQGTKAGNPLMNAAKNNPLSFAGNAFNGASTLASFAGIGGNKNSTNQTNGSNATANGSDLLSGGGMGGIASKLLMLLGLQQLLGGLSGQQNAAQQQQQPAQSQAPSSNASGKSNNPLEMLMQMLQQLLQQLTGTGKGEQAQQSQSAGGCGAGNQSSTPANGNGASDAAGQQSAGGMGGMLKNVLMMLGLNALMQMIGGGSQGQSSGQNNTQI